MEVSQFQISQMSSIIESMGGELIEVNQNDSVIFKFDDLSKMMVLVNHVKSNKKLAAKIRVNSKIVDGSNILTLDRA